MVRLDSLEHFARIVAQGEPILGLFIQDKLIAYGVLLLNCAHADTYVSMLGLTAEDKADLTCLDGAAVDPDYRGNGLQTLLTGWRLALARQAGRGHVCSTASPFQWSSWGSLLRSGLTVHAIGPFYDDAMRYVLHCDLRSPPFHPDLTRSLRIPAGDIPHQRELFREGMVGFALWRGDVKVYLVLAPPAKHPLAVPPFSVARERVDALDGLRID